MPKADYDKQGKYFWHLVKMAGWNEKRVNLLLLKQYNATHWNALTADQKRAAIAAMTRYAAQGRDQHNKRMRSTIMSLVARNGRNKSWLYETLEITPEKSLSKMDYPELLKVYQWCKAAFPGTPGRKQTNKKEEKR